MLGDTLVNRYHIDSELGRGGMGVVYRARDTLLNRAVAVKILSATDLGVRGKARLLSEAQAAAKLNHPNIVTIHDAGEAEGVPFIVMELVEGESLRSLRPEALPEILAIAWQVCAALEHAHGVGIIHRDVKPENILITRQRAAKLMDFGLARSAEGPRLTEAEALSGTFSYLAPEVLLGQPASAQSDLYALGVMLYELTTGKPPFSGAYLAAVIAQHLSAPVIPPSAHRAEIPPALDALIVQLLSKQPEERPASAAEVRARLEHLTPSGTAPLPADDASPASDPLHVAPPNAIKLLLVDDDVFNREGVRLYLRREGLEILEAGDEESAWQIAQAQPLDAAIVDISLPTNAQTPLRPGQSFGIRLAARLKQAYPALGIVLFSAYEDRGGEILELVKNGVRGLAYKLKGSPPSAILSAIHEVIAGRVVIDPEVSFNRRAQADELVAKLSPDERPWVERVLANLNQLTAREQEVAQRLAASHNTEGIAHALSVTPKTVENYISHAYDKLGLNDMGREAPHLRRVVILAKAYMLRDLRSTDK